MEFPPVLRPLLTSLAWSGTLTSSSASFGGTPPPRACKRSPVVRRSTFRSTGTGVYKTGALVNGGLRLPVQTQPTPRHASNPVRVPYLAAFASALLSGSHHWATLGSNSSFGFTYLWTADSHRQRRRHARHTRQSGPARRLRHYFKFPLSLAGAESESR